MTTHAIPIAQAPPSTRRIGLDHVVMGGAVVCLVALVVLPVGALVVGCFAGDNWLDLDNFREAIAATASAGGDVDTNCEIGRAHV